MSVLSRLLSLGPPPATAALELACRDLEAAQRTFLLALVQQHQRTVFGRQHGFSSIRSVDDFRQRVTVSGYDTFSPFVDRMLHGESNVLVPGRPEFFSLTAGTQGFRKLVPVTLRVRQDLEALLDCWLQGIWERHPSVRDGKVVCLGASANVDVAPAGTLLGNLSGYLGPRLRPALRRLNAVPAELLEIRDPEARAYATVRCALASKLTWLAGTDSHALRALFYVLDTRADLLLRDLQDGTLSVSVPPVVRRRLRPFLQAQPARVRSITQRARMAGALTPRCAWPDLKLLTCWTHGAGAEFLPEVTAAAPGVPVWAPPYASAEVCVAIPRQDGPVPGVLAAHAAFFEFIPVDAADEPAGEPLLAHELSHQGRYQVVVTTSGGLARYRLGDVVEVDGFHLRAPRVRFVQRTAARLNLQGDRTTESHARAALEAASRAEGVPVAHAALAVSPSKGPAGKPRYTFLVEPPPHAQPSPEAEQRLARALDGALQAANPGYARARQDGGLDGCTLSRLPPGRTFRVHTERARRSHAGDELKTVRVVRETALRELFDAEYEREP